MREQTWGRRRLGRTEFEVTELGIGCAWIGHQGDGDYDPEVGVQTVLAGLEAGINLVDTSDNYIGGRSEGFVGQSLEHWFGQGNRREDLILSSKLSVYDLNPEAFSYDGTMRGIERSLQEMRIDYLDIFLVHDPASLDPVLDENGSIAALRKLKAEGTIRAIGLGCRPHEHHQRCIETGEFDVSLTFHDYSLVVTTAAAGVLDYATEKDVGVFNASINASLAVPDNAERVRELTNWCEKRGIDLATLNLQYCLREHHFASILIGFSRPARIEQNVQAYVTKIDEATWADLERDFGIR
ncbi:MAG: aldo/keto reductase [Candidatus Latescibacterota bacterium]|nr:aldo/keto reductase [Candidatus Latescibacterota bacterium]